MKKIVIFLTVLQITSFSTIESDVYICVSKDAKKYHYTKGCRGLNSCKHEIRKVTLEEAESRGLGLCGWED